MPNLGDRVHVRPQPGRQVQRAEHCYGQFLPQEGQEVLWDEFHAARLQDGSLHLDGLHYQQTAPASDAPAEASAKPAKSKPEVK